MNKVPVMDFSVITSAFTSTPILMGFVFAASVLILFFGLDQAITNRQSAIETRLDRYTARETGELSSGQRKRGGRFDYLVSEKRGSAIATELARADLKITPGEYVALNIVTVVFCAVVLFALLGGNFIFGLLGGIIGFYLPRFYVRFLQGRRLRAFNNQLGDTIVLMAQSLRSGYSLLHSMETAAKELPPPMSAELSRVTREVGLGLTINEAMANMLRRMPSDDLDLLITAIN